MPALPGILQVGAGTSAPLRCIPSNPSAVLGPGLAQVQQEFAIGLIATIVSGSPTYSVQVTGDPVPSPGGNWNNHDILASLSASANSNIAYPVSGVRLVVTGDGTVNLGVVTWP